MIRGAHKEEWPTLAAVWEKAVRETHSFLKPHDFVEIKERLPEYFAAVELYVWEEEGRILGFVGLAADRVEALFVAERGKGTGRKLLDFAVKEKGAARLDVNEQNEPALGFYEKYGFEIVGRSERDGDGRPYPHLHMELKQKQ